MFMVDIAVPRDIDADVAELEDVYLFTIDDLQSVVNENLEGRRQAAREAGELIDVRGRALRASAAHARRGAADPPAARGRRSRTPPRRSNRRSRCSRMARRPDEVLELHLANTLTNRLMHAPSQRLRDAAESGDGDVIDTIADDLPARPPHD